MQDQLSTHTHCLGNIGGFVVPIHSFLWTNWTNTEGIYCQRNTPSHLGPISLWSPILWPLSSKCQKWPLKYLHTNSQILAMESNLWSMKAFTLTIDIYNITSDTLDSTFYPTEFVCLTIFNASRVTAHFSGQVSMSKIASLTLEQRNDFDSGTLHNNELEDDLLGKVEKAINEISTVLSFNMPQLVNRLWDC